MTSRSGENAVEQVRRGGLGVYDLAGRMAVVIGGSSGIGAATARRLAAAGARVAVGYHSGAERAEDVVAGLAGDGHYAVHASVLDSPTLAAAAEQVAERAGHCDVLVNCAGWTARVPHADLDALDDETFDRTLATNVRGAYAVARAFAPLLRGAGDAALVSISSISAVTGNGSSVAYCASKGGLETMTSSLARVLAPQVRVLALAPAAVDTQFVPGRDRAAVEAQAAATPLRIVVDPDDVAICVIGAITHLRLATGTVLTIDGGKHL